MKKSEGRHTCVLIPHRRNPASGTTAYASPEVIVQGETRKHPHGQLVGPVPNLERMFLQESITVH